MIWAWLARLIRKFRKTKPGGRHSSWPTREEIAHLPVFEGLEPPDIVVITTAQGAERAYDELIGAGVVGFDTESKPTFVKGHVSKGPHVAQFCTLKQAYIFTLTEPEILKAVGKLIACETLKKVGFGLSDDLRRIPIKFHVQPKAVLDLETLFVKKGYGRGVGVKVAVAIVFKRRFLKSKKASTSDWSRPLNEKQILYAANDAYAAIKVYDALKEK